MKNEKFIERMASVTVLGVILTIVTLAVAVPILTGLW